MKYGLRFVFLSLGLCFGNFSHALDIACIKNAVVRGDTCNNLVVSFDFSECGENAPASKNVRASCVNQKAVAFVKTPEIIYIATYAAPLSEGGEWRFLTLRSEARNKASTDASGFAVNVVPGTPKTSGVSSETVEVKAESKKPSASAVVIPSAPPVAVSKVETTTATEALPENPEASENKTLTKTSVPSDATAAEKPAVSKEPSKSIADKKTDDDEGCGCGDKDEGCDMDHHEHHHSEKSSEVQDPFKHSGFVDVYYMASANNPAMIAATSPTSTTLSSLPASNVQYRGFDNYAGSMSLALAELTLQKDFEHTGGRIDLGFGNSAALSSPNDIAGQNVLQAKLYYKSEKWKLTVGKMYTHMALEEPYAKDNYNYSRSILFTYAEPLWHNGAALEYQFLPKTFAATLYAYNAWSSPYQTSQPYAGLRLAWTPTEWSINYNGIYETAPNNTNGGTRQEHEMNLTWSPRKGAAISAEYLWGYQSAALTGQDAQWSAFEIMDKNTWGKYSLAARLEYVFDPQGYVVSGQMGALNQTYITQNLMSGTITGAYEVQEGARAILELRQDSSDMNSFSQNGTPTNANSQLTGTLAFLYEF